MKAKLWGTRGSVPSPGPETIRYGGNTSCVGVTLSDGSLLALDAGTGIRNLGLALPEEPTRLHILLTHLHLDHIQGLVFFAPAFRPQTEIVIWGPASPEASLRDRIARYISAPLSPVEVRELPCDVSFRHTPETEWEIGPARIRAASVSHRGPTLGYRIDDGEDSLAYIPDHEPALGADLDALEEEWISGFAPRPRRLAADPRRPVRRRRVPRPPRLGPLLDLPRALLRPPHRRQPHRCSSTTTRCTPTSSSTGSARKRASAGSPRGATPEAVELAVEGAELDVRARGGAARVRRPKQDIRPCFGTNGVLFSFGPLPCTLGCPSPPVGSTPRLSALRWSGAPSRLRAAPTPASSARPAATRFPSSSICWRSASCWPSTNHPDEVLAAGLLHDVAEHAEVEPDVAARAASGTRSLSWSKPDRRLVDPRLRRAQEGASRAGCGGRPGCAGDLRRRQGDQRRGPARGLRDPRRGCRRGSAGLPRRQDPRLGVRPRNALLELIRCRAGRKVRRGDGRALGPARRRRAGVLMLSGPRSARA